MLSLVSRRINRLHCIFVVIVSYVFNRLKEWNLILASDDHVFDAIYYNTFYFRMIWGANIIYWHVMSHSCSHTHPPNSPFDAPRKHFKRLLTIFNIKLSNKLLTAKTRQICLLFNGWFHIIVPSVRKMRVCYVLNRWAGTSHRNPESFLRF